MSKRTPRPAPTNQAIAGGERACSYLRVSTGRQALSDLSIPDQKVQIAAHCDRSHYDLVAEYVEAGATATDDQRPEFQRMIERACDDERPFDLIIVHSLSRFMRDAFRLEFYVRKLAKSGVRLVSITQPIGDDPSQVMMRQIIAVFDEYQSHENAKHVLRAMKENARQVFYNGSRLPLGFKTQEVEKRGARIKKRVIVDDVEAEIVRLIFRLYLVGDGKSGPLGIKRLVTWLNEKKAIAPAAEAASRSTASTASSPIRFITAIGASIDSRRRHGRRSRRASISGSRSRRSSARPNSTPSRPR